MDRRIFEKISGIVDDILIERCGRSDEDSDGRFDAAPGPACLLQSARNRTRIAGDDAHLQLSDIDSQLKGVCADHPENRTLAQSLFDFTAF